MNLERPQCLLPSELRLAHDLSFVLHDKIARYVEYGENNGLLSFAVSMRSQVDSDTVAGLDGTKLWEWFASNDYQHILDKYSRINLIFGLLADMCQFIFEALQCSSKGKLSVAFTLLRKPIQDNLFFLEWILSDWDTFLNHFRVGAESLDLSRMSHEDRQELRIRVIGDAMAQTQMGVWMHPRELYDIRYAKYTEIGLDPILNHAIHLVTSHKAYPTAPDNLNFLFCNTEDREILWRQLYLLLPIVLFHAFGITESLMLSIDSTFPTANTHTQLWLTSGILLWLIEMGGVDGQNAAGAVQKNALAQTEMQCPHCDVYMSLENIDLRQLWDDGCTVCNKCRNHVFIAEVSHVHFGDNDGYS